MPKNKSIPNGWLDYQPYGSVIPGTKILAFKVPLSTTISSRLPSNLQFTPDLLKREFPNLKYIIDLTYNNHYYDKTEFTSCGIQHYKINIEGGRIPAETKVTEFCRAMEMFMSLAERNEIIGVHCTHGINRTGYTICQYLIKVCGWDCRRAVETFEQSRQHRIRRRNFVQALFRNPSTSRRMEPSMMIPTPHQLTSRSRSNWRERPGPSSPPLDDDDESSWTIVNRRSSRPRPYERPMQQRNRTHQRPFRRDNANNQR